jgi:hypothetical protein
MKKAYFQASLWSRHIETGFHGCNAPETAFKVETFNRLKIDELNNSTCLMGKEFAYWFQTARRSIIGINVN